MMSGTIQGGVEKSYPPVFFTRWLYDNHSYILSAYVLGDTKTDTLSTSGDNNNLISERHFN